MVYLGPEVVKEAREFGLNISKTCKNALKDAIKRLKGGNILKQNQILLPLMTSGAAAGI